MFIENEGDGTASDADLETTPYVENEDSDEDDDEADDDSDSADESSDEDSDDDSDEPEMVSKAELDKALELADNYKIRAEKAEKGKGKPAPQTTNSKDLSAIDLYALMEAKVPRDDIQDVVDGAKALKKSIPEFLNTSVAKAILSEKQELRTSANASNTGAARRSSGKLSTETLLGNAKKGILPESQADMERLIKAKAGLK